MSAPLLSVVIPSYGRSQLLPIAVNSALQCSPDNVEVIVVPNGPDYSWRESLMPFVNEPRLRIEPITTANANAARNHGLNLARGKYIRFLDDDDQLLPAASEQISKLEASGSEICSGSVLKVDESGTDLGLMYQRDSVDLVCAMLRPERVCLPTAHVFLRSALIGMKWQESRNWEQDTEWMMQLCAKREWKWTVTQDTVGCWTQHTGTRISQGVTRLDRARSNNDLFLRTVESLASRGALSQARADACSEALWSVAHINFPIAPFFCTTVARTAIRLSPNRRPPDPFYQTSIVRKINPLLIEYLLIPRRILKNHFKLNRKG